MTKSLKGKSILQAKTSGIKFSEPWGVAFDEPPDKGVWFVWGPSGNGKTSFCLLLAKELMSAGYKVLYNSYEQGISNSMIKQVKAVDVLSEHAGRFEVGVWTLEELDKKLKRKGSANVIFMDSVQTMGGVSKAVLKEFVGRHIPKKLFVFISQCASNNKDPDGSLARSIMYDADLKIFVQGFAGMSKGRYGAGNPPYIINQERYDQYWLSKEKKSHEQSI